VLGRVTGDGDPVIDARARGELASRLRDLHEELDEAERFGDLGRSERLRAEADVIERHLASALGLGGHARRVGGPVERARKAVYNRLRAVIAAIDAEHPALGRHLARSIRTGTFCSYRPERPTAWEVSATGR
jgi:non-specific serine/threonine protein kinase